MSKQVKMAVPAKAFDPRLGSLGPGTEFKKHQNLSFSLE